MTIDVEGLSQALFEEAGDALFLLDPDTEQLLAVNACAERLTQLARTDLMRRPASYWFRFGGQGGRERLRQAASKSGVFHAQDGFFLRTRDDGVWVPVNLTVSRLHVRPRVLALITARDVREQRAAYAELQRVVSEGKQAEEKQRKLTAFLDSIVENVPIMLFVKDADSLRFELFNKAGEELLGYQRSDLIGKSDYDFFPKAEADFFAAKDREVLAGKKLVDIPEEEIETKSGLKVLHTLKIPILDDKGTPRYLLGISEEITARRALEETQRQYAEARERYAHELEAKNQALAESESRYRSLTEATLDAIVVADAQGSIVLFNPAAEKLFDYRGADVLGQPLFQLLPASASESLRRDLQRYRAEAASEYVGQVVELQGRRRDGSEFPMELALSALGQGESLQLLAAIRDLTERNRLRLILSQSEKLASVGRLSAGIAHEINNPLAYAANNLTVLERDCATLLNVLDLYDSERARLQAIAPDVTARIQALADEADLPYIRDNLGRLLQRTKEGLDRVTRIVHSLRGHARTGPATRQDASIPDLCESSLEIIQAKTRRRGIRIERDYANPPKIRCVSSDISQVLLNLLVNACQAIEAKPGDEEGCIRISVRPQGAELRIEIADNGCGIAPENQARLFDPFYTTKDVHEGSGLGLWISHNIVTAHGGRLEVDSQPGQGTRFRVLLPLRQHAPGKSDGAAVQTT
jgi:two-component system NtrC family sensor kinase